MISKNIDNELDRYIVMYRYIPVSKAVKVGLPVSRFTTTYIKEMSHSEDIILSTVALTVPKVYDGSYGPFSANICFRP